MNKIFSIIMAVALLTAPPAAQAAAPVPVIAKPLWFKRCSPHEGKQYCEAYQQLTIQNKGQKSPVRLLEFAVGYPVKGGPARAGLVTPLNIALDTPVRLQIGDSPVNGFVMRLNVCEGDGCFGFQDLTPAIVKEMRAAKKMTVTMPVFQGKNVAIVMPLTDFGTMLDTVK